MHFAKQKRRKHIRQMHLPRAVKISLGQLEILRHHAEVGILRPKHMPDLPDHFVYPHIASGISRAVVARKQQLQFFPGSPALPQPKNPAESPDFNQRADPRHQQKVGHARALPATCGIAPLASPAAGHGFAGYLNLFARLNCSKGYAYVENLAGASPISSTTHELSNTVFQSRYCQNTFIFNDTETT